MIKIGTNKSLWAEQKRDDNESAETYLQKVYDASIEEVLGAVVWMCPTCGRMTMFIKWSSYKRWVVFDADMVPGEENPGQCLIKVKRLYCTKCQHAHALIPDWLTPYKPHAAMNNLNMLRELCTIENQDLKLREKAAAKRAVLEEHQFTKDEARTAMRILEDDKRLWLGITHDKEMDNLEFIEKLFKDTLPGFSSLANNLRVPRTPDRSSISCELAEFYNARRRSFGTGHEDPKRRKGGDYDYKHLISFAPYWPDPLANYRMPAEGYT